MSLSGAFYLRSALLRSLDLGTPPIGPLIRRAVIAATAGIVQTPPAPMLAGAFMLRTGRAPRIKRERQSDDIFRRALSGGSPHRVRMKNGTELICHGARNISL
jgi:hypothetical protein